MNAKARDIEIKIRKKQYKDASNARATVKRAKLKKDMTNTLLELVEEVYAPPNELDVLESKELRDMEAHDKHIREAWELARDILRLSHQLELFAKKHNMHPLDVVGMLKAPLEKPDLKS